MISSNLKFCTIAIIYKIYYTIYMSRLVAENSQQSNSVHAALRGAPAVFSIVFS